MLYPHRNPLEVRVPCSPHAAGSRVGGPTGRCRPRWIAVVADNLLVV
jgi:hypothetical protein